MTFNIFGSINRKEALIKVIRAVKLMPDEVGRKERRNKMSEQAAHIANIILFVIVSVGFGIAFLSIISVIVRVRRGKLKFVPADPRSIDPFENHKTVFDDALHGGNPNNDPTLSYNRGNIYN